MQDQPSTAIVAQGLALRRSHSCAPAREPFDLVLQDRVGQVLVFGSELEPRTPFGQLIAEAFGEAMTPAEWSEFADPTAEPGLRAGCLQIVVPSPDAAQQAEPTTPLLWRSIRAPSGSPITNALTAR